MKIHFSWDFLALYFVTALSRKQNIVDHLYLTYALLIHNKNKIRNTLETVLLE